ncbi:hypothetical protein [Risungbinella massiliensis]|uniref:hypothetical protein n=1 Tax=Risungbinella massiliensis TaxID=1329796 RepID=UPI0005CC2928|nr:hypothetical protein [Risungbinella massiliensis]
MKKIVIGFIVFLFAFSLSTNVAMAKTFTKGKEIVTSVHDTDAFFVKAGEITFDNDNLTDFEWIDIRIELYSADRTLVETRVGNVYNFESHASSPYTVPTDGYYYFHLVNDTPGSQWFVNYKVHDKGPDWE